MVGSADAQAKEIQELRETVRQAEARAKKADARAEKLAARITIARAPSEDSAVDHASSPAHTVFRFRAANAILMAVQALIAVIVNIAVSICDNIIVVVVNVWSPLGLAQSGSEGTRREASVQTQESDKERSPRCSRQGRS